jgi:hypothetical protein
MKHPKPMKLTALVVTSLLIAAPAARAAMHSTTGELPPAQTVGQVTYVSGGSDPVQAQAMRRAATHYPLELDLLWGRGAKETPIAGVEWSIQNSAGRKLVDAHSSGPLVLASLPDGRYTVTARYEGDKLSRVVDVHRGRHDTVVLEWPE